MSPAQHHCLKCEPEETPSHFKEIPSLPYAEVQALEVELDLPRRRWKWQRGRSSSTPAFTVQPMASLRRARSCCCCNFWGTLSTGTLQGALHALGAWRIASLIRQHTGHGA